MGLCELWQVRGPQHSGRWLPRPVGQGWHPESSEALSTRAFGHLGSPSPTASDTLTIRAGVSKGPGGKRVQLCRPGGLCPNDSTLHCGRTAAWDVTKWAFW